MEIKDIMNRVVSVNDNITIRQAAAIMSKKNIGSLVVTKDGELLGLITDKEILEAAARKVLDTRIARIVVKNIETISPNQSIDNAALMMAKKKTKRLLVVKDGKLVGIITTTDIIANSGSLNEDFFFG